MTLTYKDNPFKPDFGGMPPLLAGRSDEMHLMTVCLEQLQDGATPAPVIISAPRGMGKSVLLNTLSDKAGDKGIKIRKTHAGDIKTVQGLTEWLAPEAVSGNYGHTEDPAWDLRLQDALLEGHKDTPLIICVDEAHALAKEVARSLGSLRHQMNDSKCPVWLLLAGLPGLETTLRDADATYAERVSDLRPGLLPRVDSLAALRVPFEERGWTIDDPELLNVIGEAQGYPYFLQLWGKEIWDAGIALKLAHLNAEAVDRATAKVRMQQDRFHSKRYKELMSTQQSGPFAGVDIIAVTLAVINTVRQPEGATLLDTDRAISEHLPPEKSPAPIRQYYEMKGFIWDPVPDRYQPGIPSLMNYIEEKFAGSGRNNRPHPPSSPAP